MMPAAVQDLLRTTFSEIAIQDIRPTSGGFSNLTLAATIAGILVRVQSQPQLWHEWLRRLQWTHTLRFPAG